MVLNLHRYGFGTDSTLGKLWRVDPSYRTLLCYTLEDERRQVKVRGETCIPTGTYRITLRTQGGMHERYRTRYSFHKGMLWLRDVPGFEYIYFHPGNYEHETDGCPLLGRKPTILDDGEFAVLQSQAVYKALYPVLAAAAEVGDLKVHITEAAPL